MSRPRPILLAATLFGITAGILLGLRPWRAWIEERTQVAEQRLELKRARDERLRLEYDAAGGRSPAGREERARKLGYQGPGEQNLR